MADGSSPEKGIHGAVLPETQTGSVEWRVPTDEELPSLLISTVRESVIQAATGIAGFAEMSLEMDDPEDRKRTAGRVNSISHRILNYADTLSRLQTDLDQGKHNPLPIKEAFPGQNMVDLDLLGKQYLQTIPKITTAKLR